MFKQVIISIIILMSFFLGFFVSGITKKIAIQDAFQAGWDAAKQRLVETNFMLMMEDIEIISVNGEIKDIQDNKISLSINPLEPLTDPELDERIVQVDENTKIYQLKEKDTIQYQKEVEEFNQRMQEQINNSETATESIVPPEIFTKEEVNFSDIATGMKITVTAQEDIKNIKEFKAIEITLPLCLECE